jgi:hypothetical protein
MVMSAKKGFPLSLSSRKLGAKRAYPFNDSSSSKKRSQTQDITSRSKNSVPLNEELESQVVNVKSESLEDDPDADSDCTEDLEMDEQTTPELSRGRNGTTVGSAEAEGVPSGSQTFPFLEPSKMDTFDYDVYRKGKKWNCPICGRSMSSPRALHEHIRVEHLNLKHTCTVCLQEYSYTKTLKGHYKKEHGLHKPRNWWPESLPTPK